MSSSSSSHTTTLNINDLNNLLFDMDYTAASNEYPHPSTFALNPNENAYIQNGSSATGRVCTVTRSWTYRLTVNAQCLALARLAGKEPSYSSYDERTINSHCSELAAILAYGESLSNANNGESSRSSYNVDHFTGTPAAPYMNTPYLDSTITTPSTMFTPAMSTIHGSPYFTPQTSPSDSFPVDSLVAAYLAQPAACFDGDPSRLLLNNDLNVSNNENDSNNKSNVYADDDYKNFINANLGNVKSEVNHNGNDGVDTNVGSTSTDVNSNTYGSSAPLTWHDEPTAESSNGLFPSTDELLSSLGGSNQGIAIDWSFMHELNGFACSGNEANASNNDKSTSKNDSESQKENNNNASHSNTDNHDNATSSDQYVVAPISSGTSGTPRNSRKRKLDDSGPTVDANKNKKVNTENERPYECPICKSRFSRRYNLGTHMKTHDKNRQKEFICSTCHKGFDRKHDRERHIATVHRGERQFACLDCTQSFSRKDALNRHIQKHNREGLV